MSVNIGPLFITTNKCSNTTGNSMTEYIKLVQGDSRPALVVTLKDRVTDEPINLTGAVVVLKFREAGAATLSASINGSIIDPVNGGCIFHWSSVAGALDGEPGLYEGEVEITFSDTTKQTVYDLLKFKMRAEF